VSASRRRVLLIVNPAARRAGEMLPAVREALARVGTVCFEAATQAPGDATRIARAHAASVDAVLTLGGDGTAMEAVTALAGAGPPVGVLHGGTANVLARTLRVPRAVDEAVPALLGGPEARLDLGRLADGRHFAIGLGVGLDAAMIAAASPVMKRRLGWIAYALGALRAGLRLERFAVRLTVDGQTIEREASAVLLANFGAVLGGTIRFGDGILHDDGLLTACVFSPRSRVEALRILWRMLRAGAPPHPRVLYASGRRFRLETDPPHRAQADGELIGSTPVNVEVVPEGARVLVPTSREQNAKR